MTFGRTALGALLLSTGLSACQGETPKEPTSNFARAWCISGGPIYTAVDETPKVEAVAIRKGVITYAGEDSGDWCKAFAGSNSKNIDLKEAAAYPGFTDAHAHLIGIGLREMTLNLEGTTSIEDLKERLAAVVAKTPKGETIYGRGWIETHWPEKRFPTREDLDAVTTDHVVILERSDGHASAVNSLALDKANITDETENPSGGAINRDGDGRATGMLIDKAAGLVQSLIPKESPERKKEAFIKGAELYAARGWTNIHNMSVDPGDIPMLNEPRPRKKTENSRL